LSGEAGGGRSERTGRNPFVNQVSFFSRLSRNPTSARGRNPFVNQVSFFFDSLMEKALALASRVAIPS